MSVSLENAFNARAGLLVAVKQGLKTLNENLRGDLSIVQIEKLETLLGDLNHLNQEIAQNAQIHQTSFNRFWKDRRIFPCLVVVSFSGWLMQGVSQFLQMDNASHVNCTHSLPALRVGLVAYCVAGVANAGYFFYTRSTRTTFDHIQAIDMLALEDRVFSKFLKAFGDYQANVKASCEEEVEPQDRLKYCLKCYEEISDNSQYKQAILSRDQLVSVLIKFLPDHHPLKSKLHQIYEVVRELQSVPLCTQSIDLKDETTALAENQGAVNLVIHADEHESVNEDEIQYSSLSISVPKLKNGLNSMNRNESSLIAEVAFNRKTSIDLIPMRSRSSIQKKDFSLLRQMGVYRERWDEIENILGTSINVFENRTESGSFLCINKTGRVWHERL